MTLQNYLSLGNRAMAVSGTAMLLGVGAAYPFAHHLGLALQVIAHLSIAIAAGFFKLGYVVRLAAQHELAQAAVRGRTQHPSGATDPSRRQPPAVARQL